MPVFMPEASVSGPASGLGQMPSVQVTPQFIGAHGRPDRLAWDVRVASAALSPAVDLMAQIAIEGDEYAFLLNAAQEVLSRFKVLVIAFLGVVLRAHPGMRRLAEAALDCLLLMHRVVRAESLKAGVGRLLKTEVVLA